uniref:Uncharacterized protein n=1 Tax=Asparagus officinalis TaxID=4686 RepID=Q2AA87_ASPOF|nr:hypothetical protein 17.t00018 [Asparagus officinalis]
MVDILSVGENPDDTRGCLGVAETPVSVSAWSRYLRGITQEDISDIMALLSHLESFSLAGTTIHDSIWWPYHPLRVYLVKSFYSTTKFGGMTSPLYNFIWKSPIPLKVKEHQPIELPVDPTRLPST